MSACFLALLLMACDSGSAAPIQAEPLAQFFLAPAPDTRGPLLLVSRFEITRAEFGEESDPWLAEFPAVGMTRPEAAAWARAQGMRLPTREEWLHLRTAGGAVSRETDRANTLELGLGRALPAGAIASGATGLGGYDFEGNVWEWLSSDVAPESDDGASETRALQAGGSFASYRVGPREAALREANSVDRASDVGFRTIAEALPWLHDHVLPRWRKADIEARAQMRRAVEGWGAELRVQLVRRWRQSYPVESEFALFLAGEGGS
ncbi:MAG: SUMF1/EgtB/PvdO family nonheme iron enzyme [Planctomycetes bacterium]|nr:SUMF1/EgtB/PvdO family nonheme iron enzyme [Planctomycetota bacterium]